MTAPTLGSAFDGIGGFPRCAAQLGITPVWASEIEPTVYRVMAGIMREIQHSPHAPDASGWKERNKK